MLLPLLLLPPAALPPDAPADERAAALPVEKSRAAAYEEPRRRPLEATSVVDNLESCMFAMLPCVVRTSDGVDRCKKEKRQGPSPEDNDRQPSPTSTGIRGVHTLLSHRNTSNS